MKDAIRRNVLVVDDEPHIRRIVVKTLSAAGWSCTAAGTCAQAVDMIAREEFTHAVIDIHMGLESGMEVIRALRSRRPRARIVAMTGAVAEGTNAALAAGADACLMKPVPKLSMIVEALEGDADGGKRA